MDYLVLRNREAAYDSILKAYDKLPVSFFMVISHKLNKPSCLELVTFLNCRKHFHSSMLMNAYLT